MAAPVYLGDEVSAAGYRLAGARVRVPQPGAEAAELAGARADAPLVLVSAAVAARIGVRELQQALAALSPLVVIVPDLDGQAPMPDLAARLSSQLGIEA
jgi:vacuolar-type H+-ATPase subunit F/Vma7